MFSSFNFEEAPQVEEVPKRRSRKDRSIKYLRGLSASKNRVTDVPRRNLDLEPSTSETVAPVLEAHLPAPKPGILRVHTTDETQSTSTFNPRRESKWAMVRDKSPQIVAKEVKFQDRYRHLDLNKGRRSGSTSKSSKSTATIESGSSGNGQKSFGDVVKTAMLLRNWISSMEHDERESEPDRTTTTNAEITTENDQRDILPSPPNFVTRATGWAQVKAYCKDKWYKLIYFYVTQNSAFFYYWTSLISLGTIWNMFAMCIFIFDDVHQGYFKQWLTVNLAFDFIFFLDFFVGARMTFDLEGNEVREVSKMFKNYRNSKRFILDALCLFPGDVILYFWSHISMIRVIRMIKVYRLYEFIVLTQRRTDYPHFMKIFFLTSSCFTLFHWNACVYFSFSLAEGLTEDDTNAFGFSYYKVFDPRFPTCNAFYDENCWYPEDMDVLDLRDERQNYMHEMYKFWQEKHEIFNMGNFSREYSMTMYWSSLTITKCGQQPYPSNSPQNALEIFDTLIGVLVFATIIGGVGSVVTQMSQNVNNFRQMMDGIKFYMNYRLVLQPIQDRVLNCCLYLNSHNQFFDEEEVLSLLPPRFQANIATCLHLATLSKVSLFHKCDERLLHEVVMLVKQQVFSPNDYLCRKNEKAKEMFIVKKGLLAVIDDDNGMELDYLSEAATFGELSIIHVKGNLLGDRRSVSLRSVGYSDVYVLHQDDVTRLLQEYPEERSRLLENARRMLHMRGLLETTELGEMCETFDDFEDEAMLDFLSVDEQLERLEKIIRGIDDELNQMVTSFSHVSGFFKKRVTGLEDTYNSNKKRIRTDLYNGVLETDYDEILYRL